MKRNNHNEKDLRCSNISSAKNWVEVSEEEQRRNREANSHEDKVQDVKRRPGNESYGDPDDVGVAVESPALKNVC